MLYEQEVNILDEYNLGRDDFTKKVNLTGPKTSALINELNIQNDPECLRIIDIKSSMFKRYTTKALDMLREALDHDIDIDIDVVWNNSNAAPYEHRLYFFTDQG